MKTIYFIRHAKSSWNFDMDDQHRPLSLRGRKDVFKVGRALSMSEDTPELLISSPASRALYTALFLADEWGYPEDDIFIENRLYHASFKEIFEILSEQSGDINSIAIFGHNPGFTEIVNHFSNEYIDNVPTCGVYGYALDIERWEDIRTANSSSKATLIPKRLSLKG